MIKGAIKRMGSMLLALLLVLSMVPLSAMPVSAAEISGLADLEIGLRNSGDGIWNATGTTIIGSVTGSGSTCSSSSEDTLTITNQKDTSATLSFDYKFELNDGSVVIDGVSYTNAGTFSKDLNPNESISIQLTSAEGENTTTITIENIFLYGSGTYKVVFSPAEGGSYTVDGEAVPETRLEKENESSHAYALVATAASNYKFLGWKDENNTVLSTDASTTIHIDENTTVTPWFVPEDTAVFSVDGSYYTDLNEAVEKAQESATKLVSVAMDGKLQEGTYTISSGVTLLVPFDEVNTVYTDEPANTGSAYSKPSRFRLLTMEPGAHITVSDGASISVGSKHTGVMNQGCGSPTGPYGQIEMEEGSSITLESGGSLYAYGFITGKGTVTALSGAEVWEYFQITSWRGGTASSGMLSNPQRVFPFSQYYVQNIEVPLTLYQGAKETVYTSIYSSWATASAGVLFFGDGGLFEMEEEGSFFRKQYLPEQDRLLVEISGDLMMNEINVQGFGSGSYVLPIHSGMSIHISSGNVIFSNDVTLLPGGELLVDSGAQLIISETGNLFLYDRDEWVGKHFATSTADYKSVVFTPTRTYNRTQNDLVDAKLDLNGTLSVNGNLYTSKNGANIISSEKTGQLIFASVPDMEKKLYEVTQSNTTISYVEIPITPAILQNGDGSTTSTANATEDMAYAYVGDGFGKWLPTGIYITTSATKTAYKVGDSLDVTGLSILVINNDGSQETVSVTSDMVSGFDSSAVVEKQTLTITYEGKTATYDISIARADGLEISETLAGVKPSLPGEEDGKITGLDANKSYEYRPVADPEVAWKPVTSGATEISDLAAGIYEVRYAETDTHTAGPIKEVTVPEGEATVTIVDGGTGATGSGSYKQGVAVTINAGTKTGCVFEKWTADSADVIFTNAEATKTTFTMPDHNVTITAIWHCHKDNATKNEGKAATCTEAGTREYYTCTCGMNFEDTDCTKEIQDDIDTWKIIPELGHSYGPPTFKWSQDYKSCIVVFDCTRDGCSSRQELEATVDSRTDTPASCEQMGSTAYTASVTFQEKEYQDTKTVQDIPATGHNWKPQYNWSEDLQSCSVMFTCQNDSSHTHTQNAEVTSEITIPATCTAMGTTAYTAAVTFEGKAYEDIQTKEDIPMIPHAYSDAWRFDSEKHWKECTACKTPAEEGAHTFQWIVDKPATEDETGLKHEECTMCPCVRNENTPIDKLDHIHTGITHHAAVPSTCSVQGTVEYWTCSSEKCQGKYYGDEDCQVILTSIEAELDPNNHVGETERRNAIEATCTQSGYTGDLYCLACDSLISKGESIPVKDHTYRNEWSMDAENHWKVCSICEAPGEKVEHIFTNEGDLICNECGYQRKPVLATELAISAEPDTLTGGGNVILKVTGVPEGQAVKVTCDDSEIIVTQTESVWTASLPNVSKEYTFTATSSADGETTGTAACKIEVTAYSGGGGGTPSTPSEPEEPTWPFEDVTEGDDWFYDAVAYVYENGIMAGTGETTFEPTMELNRAQAAQLFYNLEGQPAVTGDTDFTDVTSGHWAVEAITWAAQNNVVAGIGEGLYDPDSNVTREQFAQMLYNYAKYKGYDLTASGDLTQFPDAGSISSWAETALSWANGKGLINGHEDGTIDHQGSTIRAQAASIMANFDQNVVK